jgi:hypothetical protein
VQRIERNEMTGNAELSEQGLHGRDLIGFVANVDMGEHERGVGGERAEHLGGGAVIEVVEAAPKRLAIEGNAGLSGPCACGLQKGGMAAEDVLDRVRVEPLKNVADGSMGGRAVPAQSEEGIQAAAMDVDEGDDATIRVAAGHDGEDGKQQHVGQLVEFALRPAWIRNFLQQAQQRRESSHGNLRFGCRPRSQTSGVSGIPFVIRHRGSDRTCCISDSHEPLQQR